MQQHSQYDRRRLCNGEKGDDHTPQKNWLAGIKWLEKSAEQKYAGAAFDLGVMYRDGVIELDGVLPQCVPKALELLKQAADPPHCFVPAQFALGQTYMNGTEYGVPKDEI